MADSIKHNVIFVFFSNFIPSALTYVFWMIASNLTNSSIIGNVGSISSLAMILVAISSLDIPQGMKRFLGKSFSEKNDNEFGLFSFNSIIIVLILSIIVLITVFNPVFNLLEIIGIDQKFLLIIVIIVISNNLQNVFRGVLTSSLKSKSILIPSIVSSVIRLGSLGVFFFIFELSEIEIAWAYSIFYIGLAIGLFLAIKNKIKMTNLIEFKKCSKLIIQSSVSKWIPNLINVLGTNLSMLVIYSTTGASESGQFFIPYALFAVVVMLSGSINQILHPVWSGMQKEHEQVSLLEKNLLFTFLATIPLASIIILLNEEIISLFGNDFNNSGTILVILMSTYPLMIIEAAVFFLLHARGYYKKVLYVGLIANIPRIILYFVLIPDYGSIGAAYAMTVGTISQMIITIFYVRKLNIKIEYKKYILITSVSYGLMYFAYILQLGIIGGIIVFLVSYVIFLKLKIVDKNIIKEICRFLFTDERGDEVANKVINVFTRFKML